MVTFYGKGVKIMSEWTGWGLLLWFIFFPEAVKNGVANGLELGGRVLVPSIFPYLVLSGILIKTDALRKISKIIRISFLSETAKELLIPSLLCGYPTGARLSALAYDHGSITKKEFTLLFMFANVPGFGFAVSYLGGILNSSLSGWLIYLSFLLASLTLLWFFAQKAPNDFTVSTNEIKRKEPTKQKISEALVESVSESAQTMVTLLFFVCFFSSLIELLKNLPFPQTFYPIGAAFIEITTGICFLANRYPTETVVFFCGFSGLSVLFQSLYFDKKHAVNFLRLMLGRLIYGIVSVCYFMMLRLLIQ